MARFLMIAAIAALGVATAAIAQTARGDVNGDGVADTVVGSGSGVRVVDGKTGGVLLAFDSGFRGGITIAVQDQNGDGRADIIVSGDSQTRVFNGATGAVLSTSPRSGGRN